MQVEIFDLSTVRDVLPLTCKRDIPRPLGTLHTDMKVSGQGFDRFHLEFAEGLPKGIDSNRRNRWLLGACRLSCSS